MVMFHGSAILFLSTTFWQKYFYYIIMMKVVIYVPVFHVDLSFGNRRGVFFISRKATPHPPPEYQMVEVLVVI